MSSPGFAVILCLTLACATAASAADLPGMAANGWHTWRVNAVDAAPELCCFAWNMGVATQKRCNLDRRRGGIRAANAGPFPSDEVQIYALMGAGAATRIRVLSAQCPVTSDSPITDLGALQADDSVDWLARYFAPHSELSDAAITAVALHAGDAARQLLVDTAKSAANEENRETAIFWMAQARIEETAEDLRAIMFDDRSAEIRQHAGFAYSQSGAADRAAMLIRQGEEDGNAEVRSQALFWLVQTETEEAFDYLERLLTDN